MKLLRFTASGIHGYLDFDVRFYDRLTFLTGINGSGKTTVLNAIMAIISPSLNVLAEMQYRKMALEIDNNGKKIKFNIEKQDTEVTIRVSDVAESFKYFQFAGEMDTSPYRERNAELEYYRAVLSASANNLVLKFISALPTPMFLGLDRRAPLGEDARRPYISAGRFTRNIFGTSLYQSFMDAIQLADGSYRDVIIGLQRLEQQVRKEVLLKALTVVPASDYGALILPTRESLAEVDAMRKDMQALPKILGLEQNEVYNRLLPFLDLLQDLGKHLPLGSMQSEQVFKLVAGAEPENELLGRVASWSVNYPQFERIRFISEVTRKYNQDRSKLRKRSDHYLSIVNDFMKDSEKSVVFDDAGRISFKVGGLTSDQYIKALSSGEAQIFVLLTHLFFNPAAARANVFIIDEPELSLHIEWQELFVDSISAANSSIQFVLATHSPSIILERTDACYEVVAKRKRTN